MQAITSNLLRILLLTSITTIAACVDQPDDPATDNRAYEGDMDSGAAAGATESPAVLGHADPERPTAAPSVMDHGPAYPDFDPPAPIPATVQCLAEQRSKTVIWTCAPAIVPFCPVGSTADTCQIVDDCDAFAAARKSQDQTVRCPR